MEEIAPFDDDDTTMPSSQPLLVGDEIATDFRPGEAKAGVGFRRWTAHAASILLFLSSIVVFIASSRSDIRCVERQASWCMILIVRNGRPTSADLRLSTCTGSCPTIQRRAIQRHPRLSIAIPRQRLLS